MVVRLRPSIAEQFAEKIDAFALERRRSELRNAAILGPRPELEQEPALLQEALDHLRIQHAELIVAEEELRAQLEELSQMGLRLEGERGRYVELFEHAPDPYLVTDHHGVVHDANAAAVTLLGLEFRFLRSKPLATFVARAGISLFHASLDELGRATTAEPRTIELLLVPRGGEPVRVVARIAKSAATTNRFLWTLRRAELPAVERAAGLERTLRDTEDLLARERRIRGELERANEAKDRFIAVLSHDLRSPLNAILGWVELLQREVLDGVARKRAYETIERNAQAQAGLIEELLDISRMAADRFHVELVPTDLAVVVERVVEGALPSAAKVEVALAYTRPEGEAPCTVLGDVRRLEQIVTNLVTNALKFTPAGGKVDVALVRSDHEIQLVVRDDGKGIAPSLLGKLFDLYTQGRDYATTRNGLGLGLYIVKRLVQLQDGTVAAVSDGPGAGATFTVTFPQRTTPSEAPPRPSGVRPLGDLRGRRVLVVDDEADTRELVAAIMTRTGAVVHCAKDAGTALELHAHGAFDVVISDLAMPGIDGCALLEQLRARDPAIAAVAISGFATEADGEHALAAGFDAYLAKPADANAIVAAIKASLERRPDRA